MTTGIVDKIKGVKDKVLFSLEELKKDNDNLSNEQAKLYNALLDVVKYMESLNQQVHDLADWTKTIEQQQHEQLDKLEKLDKLVTCTNDAYSYPLDVQEFLRHNPEVALLQYLRSYLPSANVVDIGANVGMVSEFLLSAGYRVFAFEPFEESYKKLSERFVNVTSGFKSFPVAVGAKDGTTEFYQLQLATPELEKTLDSDLSVYGTTVKHAVPEGLHYSDPIEVKMRSLKSLHSAGELPADISIVKIDTEGGDLEVIRGMGSAKYSVVMSEFWDVEHYFSDGEHGLLQNTVAQLRARGYGWHIVIYRKIKGESSEPRFYCNVDQSVRSSWGNAIFFRDYEVFKEALKWCSAMIRANNSFGP